MEVDDLGKYIYKLSERHIICFPSLTSTSILKGQFAPTPLSKKVNEDKNKKKVEKNDKIQIEMIIKYKHEEGNITPALNIVELSNSQNEEERLVFPFTFFRINSISKKLDCDKTYIFDMEIINRKKIIEYDLKEGKRYNIEDLEELYDENKTINLEDGKQNTFKVKEEVKQKKSNCNIF